ncbi:hypothetical protein KAM380_014280 [Aeromonas caviae]|nr:hypothetical protein KAM380_014280 [Aeromonas caviae]
MLQAFLGLGQQYLRIQQEPLQGVIERQGAVHHDAPARGAGTGDGHAKTIASKSLTPFMQ